jgi:hypothetical protein
MRLCSLCAGELPAGSHHCPRCGAPVSPDEGLANAEVGVPAGEEASWAPPPPTAPSSAGVASAYPYQVAGVPPPRRVVRWDWPGALKAAALAMLGGYVLAAGIATLLSPTGSTAPVLWVAVPAALLAVALGGQWQASITEAGEPAGSSFGYQVHAFPLLLTALIAVVLARSVRSRFETGRANDTLRDRLSQALLVGAAMAGAGLIAAAVSRLSLGGGLVTHAGYISAPAGGLLIGLAVGLVTAIGYDLSQLPPRFREFWVGLREPLRAARLALLVVTVAGTLGVLVALEAAPSDQLVVSDEDRRVLSGLAIATAPNLGWWFLVACLGAPVRADLLSGERGDGFGALFGHPAWWVPAAALASVLLAAIAVRLVSGAPDMAQARRRLVVWAVLAAIAAPAFLLLGTIRVLGGVGLFPVEYMIGSTSVLAVILPPLWVALAGAAGYATCRALRSVPRPEPTPG